MGKQPHSGYDDNKFNGVMDWPHDIHDAMAWDAFWVEVLDSPLRDDAIAKPPLYVNRFGNSTIRQMKSRDVLFIDAGLSALPYFMAHMGHRVRVMEISPFAVEYGRNGMPAEHFWYTFFASRFIPSPDHYSYVERLITVYRDKLDSAVSEHYTPGGTLTYECCDVFTPRNERAIADVAVVCHLVDACNPLELITLAASIHQLVRSGGIVYVRSNKMSFGPCIRDRDSAIESAFRQAGFIIEGDDAFAWARRRNTFWRRVAYFNNRHYADRERDMFYGKLEGCKLRDIETIQRDGGKLVIFDVP